MCSFLSKPLKAATSTSTAALRGSSHCHTSPALPLCSQQALPWGSLRPSLLFLLPETFFCSYSRDQLHNSNITSQWGPLCLFYLKLYPHPTVCILPPAFYLLLFLIPNILLWTEMHLSKTHMLTTQFSTWVCLVIRSLKSSLRLNEVIRVGPYSSPTWLVSLGESRMRQQTGSHRENRPCEPTAGRQLSARPRRGTSGETKYVDILILDFQPPELWGNTVLELFFKLAHICVYIYLSINIYACIHTTQTHIYTHTSYFSYLFWILPISFIRMEVSFGKEFLSVLFIPGILSTCKEAKTGEGSITICWMN